MSLPSCENEVAEAVLGALARGDRLAVTGGGSKDGAGRDVATPSLPMSGIAGVVDYDPPELILTVRPGTPLAQVQALVAAERQMLAFEPFDHGPIHGRQVGGATIGGTVAAGVAGSRRVSAGGARDHLLGFRAVSGRGEAFAAGAKVVKNVTGYDLPKLVCGSWGRLVALTELTLKVLPRPDATDTRYVVGLDRAQAVAAMAAAMGSQADVACAAHRPAGEGRAAITALRIEGFAPSVRARGETLDRLLAPFGSVERPDAAEAGAFWTALATLDPLPADRALWRVNVPPRAAPAIVAAIEPAGAAWLMDWAGGLVWIALDGAAETVRAAAAAAGGHATLIRADAATRDAVAMFHPQPPALDALEGRVRRAFDPAGVFETGRF